MLGGGGHSKAVTPSLSPSHPHAHGSQLPPLASGSLGSSASSPLLQRSASGSRLLQPGPLPAGLLPVPKVVSHSIYCKPQTQAFVNHPMHKF